MAGVEPAVAVLNIVLMSLQGDDLDVSCYYIDTNLNAYALSPAQVDITFFVFIRIMQCLIFSLTGRSIHTLKANSCFMMMIH